VNAIHPEPARSSLLYNALVKAFVNARWGPFFHALYPFRLTPVCRLTTPSLFPVYIGPCLYLQSMFSLRIWSSPSPIVVVIGATGSRFRRIDMFTVLLSVPSCRQGRESLLLLHYPCSETLGPQVPRSSYPLNEWFLPLSNSSCMS